MVELFFPVFCTLSHITTLEDALVILIRGLLDLLLGHWLSSSRAVGWWKHWKPGMIRIHHFGTIVFPWSGTMFHNFPQFVSPVFSLTNCVFFRWVSSAIHHRISTRSGCNSEIPPIQRGGWKWSHCLTRDDLGWLEMTGDSEGRDDWELCFFF